MILIVNSLTMKKNIRILIYTLTVVMLVTLTGSCKKDSKYPPVPPVDYTGQKGTVNDIDGNIYHTIGNGTQVWMAENLKVTKYRIGDAITVKASWHALTNGAYCWYNNDEATYKADYGACTIGTL